MPISAYLSALMLSLTALLSLGAHAACAPVRVAYIDQNRPPYWLGDGEAVAEPAGAGVDVLREALASAGCEATLVRLPPRRIIAALASGEVDFAPVEELATYPAGLRLPAGPGGAPDVERAVSLRVDLIVRADTPLPATDLNLYLHGRTLGVPTGSTYAAALRRSGALVDDGARDLARNLDKLRLHRLDGVAVSVLLPGDVDAFLAADYPGQFRRVEQPLITTRLWLASSEAYYRQHREQAEAVWNWLGPAHRAHVAEIVKRYTRPGQ